MKTRLAPYGIASVQSRGRYTCGTLALIRSRMRRSEDRGGGAFSGASLSLSAGRVHCQQSRRDLGADAITSSQSRKRACLRRPKSEIRIFHQFVTKEPAYWLSRGVNPRRLTRVFSGGVAVCAPAPESCSKTLLSAAFGETERRSIVPKAHALLFEDAKRPSV